jgi:cellulose biosynthesis protein BcsQ
MTDGDALAFVGAAGGAGTTRLTLEAATLLAREGREVIALDAAYATQGMARWLGGRLAPDVTALVTDRSEEPLDSALVDLDVGVEGRVRCVPARAPFERIARAKRPEAAERFGERVAEAATLADAVCLDVPPVAANQSVAAATAADGVALVAPADERGADAIGRMEGVLTDVGVSTDAVVATGGELDVTDVSVPAVEEESLAAATGTGAFVSGVAGACSALLGEELSAGGGGLFGGLGEFVSR